MDESSSAGSMFAQASARFSMRLCAVMLGILLPGFASAQESSWQVHPALQDTWTLQLGAFRPTVDTTASLNGAGGRIGTKVKLEDDLGFSDRDTLGSVLGSVRIGERWKIEAEYFSLDRSNSRTINRTIEWGDRTFTASTVVSAEFDSSIYRLSGGYSFVKDDHLEVGVALGLFATDFSASLGTTATGTDKGDTLAPLPTIGLYGAYAFTPRWLLSGRVDYFSLNRGDYDGSLVNFTVGVDYRFARHFGIGAGYRYVNYDLDVSKSKYNGSIKYEFSGPTLYAVGSF